MHPAGTACLAPALSRAPALHPATAHPPCCRLNLGVAPLLEKNLEYLNDCLDDLMVEQGKLSMYQAQQRRQLQAIAQFKMQRRQENMARRAAGGGTCRWGGVA